MEKKEHPSYGIIRIARSSVSGRGTALFGSSIMHNNVIRLTITPGVMERDANEDRFFPKERMKDRLIEVEMSYTQFAEAITSLNMGQGVPVGGKENAMSLLKAMGLDETQSRRNVMQLSGGQQQRVAIARALASNAPVLLADEPTGNLDEGTANEIIAIFSKLAHEKNKCVIIVTHSKELAQKADVILTLKKGSIVETEDTVLNEKIRETLSGMIEGVSASDNLKDKIMKEIEKQSN